VFFTKWVEFISTMVKIMYSSERLKGIDVFVSVADEGSFTLAAERLHLTTSAVSKSVARLEKRLRIRLFDRTTRRLALTDAGMEFYRVCTGVLTHLEEVELSLHENREELKGKIRIDLPASYGRLHVLPVILKFCEEHPDIEPLITLSDRFADPVSERIDVIVRTGGSGIWPSEIGNHLFGIQRLIFCASPVYLANHGTPKNKQELHKHGCILYVRNDGYIYPLHFSDPEKGRILRPVPGKIAVGDSEGQALAVLAGKGIAQLPVWLVQEHLRSGKIVQILPELETDGLPMNLAWLRSRERVSRVRALVQRLKETLTPSGVLLP
jgi:DNA-binding transcriptional LysR family regulator